jgi:hypothetical protein
VDPAAFVIVSIHQSTWARVVRYGPLSLCVIHKEGLSPSSGGINRLMMIMMMTYILPKRLNCEECRRGKPVAIWSQSISDVFNSLVAFYNMYEDKEWFFCFLPVWLFFCFYGCSWLNARILPTLSSFFCLLIFTLIPITST